MSNPKIQLGSDNKYYLERIIGNDRLDLIVGVTSSKTALSITDDGNVSFGTNSSANSFTIRKDQNAFTTLELRNNDNTNADTTGSQIIFGTYRDIAQTTFEGAKIRAITTNASGSSLFRYADLAFYTNNELGDNLANERMRILSGGNIGIGTTNPVNTLEVRNSTFIQGLFSSSASSGGIKLKNNGSYEWELQSVVTTNNFAIVDRNVSGTSRLVINPSGNVGIGTTNPTQMLVLYGPSSSYINIDRAVTGSDSGIRFQDTNVDEWVFYSRGTDGAFLFNEGTLSTRMLLQAGGNLGIGTTNPSNILHVEKNQNASTSLFLTNTNVGTAALSEFSTGTSTTSADCLRMICLGTGYTTAGAFVQDGAVISADTNLSGGLSLVARHTSGIIRFYTSSSLDNAERMRINASGNVGIGTTNPTQLLEVYAQSSAAYININRATTASDCGIRFRDTGTDEWVFYSRGSDGAFLFNEGTSSTRLTLQAGGNLGIGITSPTSKIHMWDSQASAFPELLLENPAVAGTGGIQLGLKANARQFNIGVGNSGNVGLGNKLYIYDNTAGSSRFIIDSSGNVGIGTTSPGSTLDVNGGMRTRVTTLTTGTYTLDGTYSIIRANTVGGNITINLPAVASFTGTQYKIIKTNASNSVTIDANGTETIDGSTTNIVLSSLRDRIFLVCDGSEWHTF